MAAPACHLSREQTGSSLGLTDQQPCPISERQAKERSCLKTPKAAGYWGMIPEVDLRPPHTHARTCIHRNTYVFICMCVCTHMCALKDSKE